MIPRYRVEHRAFGEATLIVGFADAPLIARAQSAVAAARFLRDRIVGEVVIVDQETDEDLDSRSLSTTPTPS